MDPDFTFPARPRPTPRLAPQSPVEPANRESNALRASVLDAALELGFTSKSMANWMFSHTLDEDEEEPGEHSPGRGQFSPTSDEYAPYSTPPTSTESHSESLQPSPLYFPASGAGSNPVSALAPQVHFPPAPPATNKLRKRRDPTAAGYESDGGYVSDAGKKAKTRTRTKSKPKDPDPALVFPIGEPPELIPLSKEERKRQKKEKEKAAKAKNKDFGNETDVEDGGKAKSPAKSKKNKKNSADAAGYETDDGHGKQKARSRFFSLRKKSDSAAAATEPPPPPLPIPVPEHEAFELPIASRFATTLGSAGGSGSGAPSRAETPLLPPSRPFAYAPPSSPVSSRAETPLLPPSRPFASGSSSPSFSSSSANSLLTPGDQDGFGSPSINAPSFADEDNWRNGDVLGHTADKSLNSTLTVTPASLSSSSSRRRSLQPPTKSNTNANAKSKILISYPLTRTPSPGGPPGADQNTTGLVKPRNITVRIPDPISLAPPSRDFNSRAASPGPSPVGSPFVLLTPVNANTGRISPAPSPSPYGHGYASPEIVPSTQYLVPSPSSRAPSPSPPPNVLAYYDVPPPPSPPPSGPLPRVPRAPPSAMRDAPTAAPGGVARLRSISRDRSGGARDALGPAADLRLAARSPSPNFAAPWPAGAGGAMHDGAAVQRGRESPFPSQPILQTRAAAAGTGLGPGLAARAKVQRYRDLYAIQIPDEHAGAGARRGDSAYGGDVRADEGGDGEEADPEMVGVLGRFRGSLERERAGSALERNNSGALRRGRGAGVGEPGIGTGTGMPDSGAYSDDDEASRYPDEERTAGRATMYRFDNDSRGSFLDMDKSEQVRGRLVDRIGAMYDLSGRERPAIPPVPKLPPELLAAGGRGNNRF